MSSIPNNNWISLIREWITSPVGIIVMTCGLVYVAYMNARREHPTYDDDDYLKEGHGRMEEPLQHLRLTRKTLKDYNSKNTFRRYLVGFQGLIYDVSCAPHDFGPNGTYEALSGTDIFWYVKEMADFEARDIETLVKEWKTMLEDCFFVAGELDPEDGEEGSDDTDGFESTNEEEDGTPELEPVLEVSEEDDQTLCNAADITVLTVPKSI